MKDMQRRKLSILGTTGHVFVLFVCLFVCLFVVVVVVVVVVCVFWGGVRCSLTIQPSSLSVNTNEL